MPIDIVVDKTSNLVTRTVRGATTRDELIQSIEGVLAHPDFHPGMMSLSDLRDAALSNETVDVKALAKFLLSNADKLHGGKAAVVVSRVLSYGMMRMLQTFASESPLEIAVYYDLQEARKWLGLAESQMPEPSSE